MGIGVYGGVAAARRAAWMPAGASILVCEPAAAVRALPEAVARRKAGEPVLVSFVLPPHRAAIARRVAGTMLMQSDDYDRHIQILDQLVAGNMTVDGHPLSQYVAFTNEDVETMRLLSIAADGVHIAGWHEYEFLKNLAVPVKRAVRFAAPHPDVPNISRGRGHSVVVWGPDYGPEELALPALALQELHSDIVIVSTQTATHPQLRARFITQDAAAEELARAAVILDYTGDTGTAIALGGLGIPLAVPSSGSAIEYLDHVTTFDEWNRSSLRSAVQTAMARRAPRLRPDAPTNHSIVFDVLEDERPKPVKGGPMVSLVCGTYNRRHMLERMLAMCEAQTYENLEIVVVNDCGDPVDDIVAKFPRARLITSPENLGPFKVYNLGVKEARGEFVKVFADDDYMFPDTIAAHVQAMERSGAEIVHHDALSAIEEPFEGGYRPTGYIAIFSATMDRNQTLVTVEIGCGTILYRKSVWEELGGCDNPPGDGSDMELVAATSERYEFAHLDRMLYLHSIRTDESNVSFKPVDDQIVVEAFERFHERHPAPGRPMIEARRQEQHKRVAQLRHMPQPVQRIVY